MFLEPFGVENGYTMDDKNRCRNALLVIQGIRLEVIRLDTPY